MIVFSGHADTNFKHHLLTRKEGELTGYLDNFAGVYALMKAYFSGEFVGEHGRIVLTDHEETTFQGAEELKLELQPTDLVVVVDVTGIIGDWDFTIEKCMNPLVKSYLDETLQGFKYRLFQDSPDPVADSDEVDVYRDKCPYTFFLGVPCSGGDYNQEQVKTTQRSIEEVTRAILALHKNYPNFEKLSLEDRHLKL